MELTDRTAKRVYLYIIVVRDGDDWRAVCVVDGRDYIDPEDAHSTATGALKELSRRRIVSEMWTEVPYPDEPPLPLPTWHEYRAQLERSEEAGDE